MKSAIDDDVGSRAEDHGVKGLGNPIKEDVGLVLPLLVRTPFFVFEIHSSSSSVRMKSSPISVMGSTNSLWVIFS